MRPSLRFLALAVAGWIGVRAAALGMLPGADLFRIERSEAKTPPIIPTQFAPVEPIAPPQPEAALQYPAAYYPQQAVRPVMVPVYYAAPASTPAAASYRQPETALPSRATHSTARHGHSTTCRCPIRLPFHGRRAHRCRPK